MNSGPNDLQPCVVVRTRYSGVYEGGRWAAFQAYPEDLVGEDWAAGDTIVAGWWAKRRGIIGIGESPEEAYAALRRIPESDRWRPRPEDQRDRS
jgi:hypothetical protein